ncbi:MAG: hypothetical protein MJY67_07440 [Bacteroidales bacterium]|nr:hypothetical protein [Bacteroidales bacterium]
MQIINSDIPVKNIIKRSIESTWLAIKDAKEELDDLDILRILEENVWGEMAKSVKRAGAKSLSSIEAMLSLIKSGVDKSKVRFLKGTYMFQLENALYHIKKEDPWKGAMISPGVIRGYISLSGLSKEKFAEIIYSFDSIVPLLECKANELLEKLKTHRLALKQKETVEDIIKETVESLLLQYLEPLGLSYDATIKSDNVHLKIFQHKEVEMDINITDLATRLQDSASLLTSMRTRHTASVKTDKEPYWGFYI